MRPVALTLKKSLFIMLFSLSPLCYANTATTPTPAAPIKQEPAKQEAAPAPLAPESQATSNTLCPKPLIVGWTGYPPFQIANVDPKIPPSGVEIDILHAIGEKIGCRFIYQQSPSAREMWDLKQNTVDLLFSPMKTDAVAEYAYFTRPYRDMNMHLIVRKGEEAKYTISSLEDLKNSSYVFGVKRGIYYGPEFEKLVAQTWFQSHIEFNVTSTMNLQKLVYGRLDGVFLEPVVKQELAKKIDATLLLSTHPFTVYTGPVYILLSKKSSSTALVDAFDKALEAMEKEGEIKALMTKYGV